MTAKERNGAIIIVLLFVVFGVILAVSVRRSAGPGTGTFENNPIVEQRLINLQKNR
jgi:hypothetical protein